jgi:D-alanine-D-alanine ligase
MASKLRVAVLLGGRSAEHDVSILSATNVLKALDPAKYDVVPILITRSGKWLILNLEDGALPNPIPETSSEICLVPGGRGRLFVIPKGGPAHELPPIDILFPVLHGLHGEDGSIQGLAEVAMVPFVGCGILGSAIAIDRMLPSAC